MSLYRYGFKTQDHSLWQILIVCHGQEFVEHGAEFIADCEFNSPGLRLVFLFTDACEQASAELARLERYLYSTIVYRLELEDISDHSLSKTLQFSAVRWLLDHTSLPVLMMDLQQSILRDLSVLPVELQRAQLAFPEASTAHHKSTPLTPIWFRPDSETIEFAAVLASIFRYASASTMDGRFIKRHLHKICKPLRLVDLPHKYWLPTTSSPAISSRAQATDHFASWKTSLFIMPSMVVLMPRQAEEEQVTQGSSSFNARVRAFIAPQSVSWRHSATKLAHQQRLEDPNLRVLQVSPSEINQSLISRLSFVKKIYVPSDLSVVLSGAPVQTYDQCAATPQSDLPSSPYTELAVDANGLPAFTYSRMRGLRRIRQVMKYMTGKASRVVNWISKVTRKIAHKVVLCSLNKHLMPILSDEYFRAKRVVLVGNASSLLQQNLGEFIDAHDVVIRMNLGSPFIAHTPSNTVGFPHDHVYGEFADQRSSGLERYTVLSPHTPRDLLSKYAATDATGTRTDIWSCSTADQTRQHFFGKVFAGALFVACHPNFHFLSQKFLMKYGVKRLKGEVTRSLQQKLKLEPTSGLIWIEYLKGTHLSELSLVGFDFSQSGHSIRAAPSTLDAKGWSRHRPDEERDYVLNTVLPSDSRIKFYSYDTQRSEQVKEPECLE